MGHNPALKGKGGQPENLFHSKKIATSGAIQQQTHLCP
jgi:hypothetical protein